MTFPIARIGDMLTHGAMIITGDHSKLDGNNPIARIGDMIMCPEHGVQMIIGQAAKIVNSGNNDTAHLTSMAQCGASIITAAEKTIIDRALPNIPNLFKDLITKEISSK